MRRNFAGRNRLVMSRLMLLTSVSGPEVAPASLPHGVVVIGKGFGEEGDPGDGAEAPNRSTTELQMPVGIWQDSNLRPVDDESKKP